MHIDNRDPKTFVWILEKFDMPYIEQVWIELTNKNYMKNPSKFGPKSVIGMYLRMMNMAQYQKYSFADSDRLNEENAKSKQIAADMREAQEETQRKIREKFDSGLISEAEYQTLSFDTPSSDQNENFIPDLGVDEEAIRKELTEEDMQYLISKWGFLYKPSQLVQMESLYQKYANEYELNIDREEILKKICKISLKMDEAIDMSDIKTFKDLSTTFDQLRKSGKFTEAQNKEEQERYLDSIGELVSLVEREGGAIPQFCDPDEYPQDKIDFTLKDLKTYNYNLAVNELNLGDLIESYIEKLEKAEAEDVKDLNEGLITNAEEEAAMEVTDDEAFEFQKYLEEEIEADAERLLRDIGDFE